MDFIVKSPMEAGKELRARSHLSGVKVKYLEEKVYFEVAGKVAERTQVEKKP